MNTEEQKVNSDVNNVSADVETPSFNIGGVDVSAPTGIKEEPITVVPENVASNVVSNETSSFNIGGVDVSAPTGSKEEPVTIVPDNIGNDVIPVVNEIKDTTVDSDVVTTSSVDVSPEISTQENIPELTPEVIESATTVNEPVVENNVVSTEVTPTEVVPEAVTTPTEVILENVADGVPMEQVTPVQAVMTDNTVETIAPSQGEVINTEKAKGTSPLIIFIILIVGVALVFSMDKILLFIQNAGNTGGGGSISEIESSNLVDGFIQIDVTNSYMKTKKIKFYNFKKVGNKTINYNYVSDDNYKTVSDLKLFVEVYDSNKDLIHKEQFNLDSKLDKDNVLNYNLKVSNDVYESAYYVKVLPYTDEMINKKDSMICSYPVKNTETFTLTFTTTYNFVNDLLVSYDVVRKYETTDQNDIVELYKKQIKDEYLEISNYNIKTEYADNKLVYSVSLDSMPQGFIPMHAKGSTKKTIKNKEALKKWNCK